MYVYNHVPRRFRQDIKYQPFNEKGTSQNFQRNQEPTEKNKPYFFKIVTADYLKERVQQPQYGSCFRVV